VLEVIETVKRVFGIDFEVAFVGRRAGDPAQIVAAFNLLAGSTSCAQSTALSAEVIAPSSVSSFSRRAADC
jgi:UDP-glucose 4-epimerase